MLTERDSILTEKRHAGATIVALLSRLRKNPILLFLARRGPAIAALLIAVSFIIVRLPFFLHFRLIDITADTWSYFAPVLQARHGQWPNLWIRTPGYPLFLGAVLSISQSALAVVIAQCAVTLVAALGTLACFVRVDRRLTYPAAFALIGFVSSMHSVEFDTMLMSESLYCSLLMLSLGLVTLAVLRGGAPAFVGASFAMAACMLTRPSGFFFFGVYGLVLGWLLLRRRPRRHILAFLLPIPIIFLALCSYNRLTMGSFIISPFSNYCLFGAVATFIEEDPAADASVNAMVREIRDSVTPEDRAVVLTSRNIDELYPVFFKYYRSAQFIHAGKIQCEYVQCSRIWGRLARLAIRRHPELYLKFIAVNSYEFYRLAFISISPYERLQYRYDYLYVRRVLATTTLLSESDRRDMLMEYWDSAPQSHVRRVGEQIVVDNTWSRRMHELVNRIHAAIFLRVIWLFVAILLFPVAIWKLVRSRARDAGAFLAFMYLSALAGSGFVVGLTVFGLWRYGVTSLFMFHLTPLYLCLLTWRGIGTAAETASSGPADGTEIFSPTPLSAINAPAEVDPASRA
jgi:hypothetical protein